MLSNILPGLRELRAPLAAGYLWLLALWLWLPWDLPAKDDLPDTLRRLYDLAPLVSAVGMSVVVSVAAFILGSIVLDLQGTAGRAIVRRLGSLTSRSVFVGISTEGVAMLHSLKESVNRPMDRVLDLLLDNRQVVKIALLDDSPTIYAEVDRPEAEATFRLALWPPLSVIVAVLTINVSLVWGIAAALPIAVARQWWTLRSASAGRPARRARGSARVGREARQAAGPRRSSHRRAQAAHRVL